MERKSRSSRTLEESNEELTLWKQICSLLIKLEGIQKDEETILNSINKIQLSVNTEQSTVHIVYNFIITLTIHYVGITAIIHQKLKDNYRRGIELSSNEYK